MKKRTIFITGSTLCALMFVAIAYSPQPTLVPVPSYRLYNDGRIEPLDGAPEFEEMQRPVLPLNKADVETATAYLLQQN